MTTPARSYPIAPALHAIAAMTGRPLHPIGLAKSCPMCTHHGCVGLAELARRAHVEKRSASRWVTEGGIPEPAADRLACDLGLHLDIIWPADHLEHVV